MDYIIQVNFTLLATY